MNPCCHLTSPCPARRRRRRGDALLLALALAPLAAALLVPTAVARPPGPAAVQAVQDEVPHLYLPLAGRSMGLEDLAPVRTAPAATRTPVPSNTPRATNTPAPTDTPTPPPTPTPRPLDAEETGAALLFSGAWQQVADARASGGAYKASSTAGAEVAIAFGGDHLVLYRTMDRNGGQAEVTLDGQPFGGLEFYFAEKRYQVPAIFDNLGEGNHTLVLTVSDEKHQRSSGTLVTVDRVRAPGPYASNEAQLASLDRSNWYRDITDLPRFLLDRAINLAAENHASYDLLNHGGHGETFGKSGFTGERFWDRLRYTGYWAGSSEVMYFSYWSGAVGPDPGVSAPEAVDGWMATVYHRIPFMDWFNTHIGYGEATGANSRTSVIDFGNRDAVSPYERHIATYPVDDQSDVPTSWDGVEAPDPLPGKARPVGYPASLHIAQPEEEDRLAFPWAELAARLAPAAPAQEWRLTSARLYDAADREVLAYVLDQASDPHKVLDGDIVFVIAQKPMQANARYTVHVRATDTRGEAVDQRWSFTTGAAEPTRLPPGLDVRPGNAVAP